MTPGDVVAVIGAGTMGAGIAQVAAVAGHPVLLADARADAVAKAVAKIHRKAPNVHISTSFSLQELAHAALVIEAVVEDLAVKREVFASVEKLVSPECILATNTSSISITAIAAALQNPARLAGMHFFNPAPVMQLVEVVSGLTTSRESAEAIFATAAAWGKTPVRVKSSPGFIVNRVARPFYLEALRMLREHVASPATIDAAMREAGGFRMGPFELMDLIGNDVNLAVSKSIFEAYFYEPRFRPSLLQQELVDAGWFGRKTGRGWYEYGENARQALPETGGVRDNLIVDRIVRAVAEEGKLVVGEGICSEEDLNIAMRKGMNWPRGPLEWGIVKRA